MTFTSLFEHVIHGHRGQLKLEETNQQPANVTEQHTYAYLENNCLRYVGFKNVNWWAMFGCSLTASLSGQTM